MTTDVQCPKCKGWRVWKKGLTPTLQGRKVRYICAVCGKTFYTQPVALPKAPQRVALRVAPKAQPKAQPKALPKRAKKAVTRKSKTGGKLRLRLRKTAK